jgi:hypothetical protein
MHSSLCRGKPSSELKAEAARKEEEKEMVAGAAALEKGVPACMASSLGFYSIYEILKLW